MAIEYFLNKKMKKSSVNFAVKESHHKAQKCKQLRKLKLIEFYLILALCPNFTFALNCTWPAI